MTRDEELVAAVEALEQADRGQPVELAQWAAIARLHSLQPSTKFQTPSTLPNSRPACLSAWGKKWSTSGSSAASVSEIADRQ